MSSLGDAVFSVPFVRTWSRILLADGVAGVGCGASCFAMVGVVEVVVAVFAPVFLSFPDSTGLSFSVAAIVAVFLASTPSTYCPRFFYTFLGRPRFLTAARLTWRRKTIWRLAIAQLVQNTFDRNTEAQENGKRLATRSRTWGAVPRGRGEFWECLAEVRDHSTGIRATYLSIRLNTISYAW